jgi:hypothetical protein
VEDFKRVVENFKLVVDLVFSTLNSLFHLNYQKKSQVWVMEFFFQKYGSRLSLLDSFDPLK